MKAKNVAVVESNVLENKTYLAFVPKFKMYYVKYKTYLNIKMRSICDFFIHNYSSDYV